MMSSRSQLQPQNQGLIIAEPRLGPNDSAIFVHPRLHVVHFVSKWILLLSTHWHSKVKLRHKKQVRAKVSTPKFAGSWRQKHWYEASILPTTVTVAFFCIQHPITRRHTFSILALTLVQGAMVDNVRFKCALSRTFADFLAKVAFSCEPEPPPVVGLKPPKGTRNIWHVQR